MSNRHVNELNQQKKQTLPKELLFLIALWTLMPCLLLFLFVLALGYFRASLQIQVFVVVVGAVVIAVRTFRLYKGVKKRMLAKVKAGPETLVGAVGAVTADLKPKGEIRVNGEFWQASAKEGWIQKGEEVQVVDVEGLTLVVRVIEDTTKKRA